MDTPIETKLAKDKSISKEASPSAEAVVQVRWDGEPEDTSDSEVFNSASENCNSHQKLKV